MKTKAKNLFTPILLTLCFSLFGNVLQAQVAVIAHPDVPIDSIDENMLLDFYSGDIQQWNNGEKITVYDLKKAKKLKNVFYKYMGKSSSRMKSIWMKKMLAGEGEPPEAISDEKSMLQKVAETPGAVGFISTENLDDSVKLIATIDGG
ncbi:MAG: hypothetical protein AAFP70_01900 [Calditrichota bacterium]